MTDSAPSIPADHTVPGGGPSAPPPLVPVEPVPRRTPAEEARTLLAGTSSATLATLTADGEPWASLVTYGALADGSPVLCVSTMAEHGRNLEADPRASLLVSEAQAGDDPLAVGRVTLAGRAERPAEADAAAARAAHPGGEYYADFADFKLYVLHVERVRWVGGYGRMATVDADVYAAAVADPVAPAAPGAIAHLNADHADALLAMAQALGGYPDATAAQCTGADRYGLDLAVDTPRGRAPARVGYAQPITAPDGLRAATVELARRARRTADPG